MGVKYFFLTLIFLFYILGFVYYLEKSNFKVEANTFQDNIKVNIYDDLWIDFKKIVL